MSWASFKTMQKLLKDWSTGIDGKTHDPARASFIVSVVSFIGLSAAALWLKGQWDAMNFGGGLAAIVAGHGWAIKAKSETEPKV